MFETSFFIFVGFLARGVGAGGGVGTTGVV